MIRARLSLTPCLVLAAALLWAGSAAAGEGAGKPKIVKIHADWCGTCQRLNPTFEALQREVGDEAVLVVLDVTDREATERSRARAEELGITAFFDAHKAETGTIGVLDADGEPVAVLQGETDTAKYMAVLEKLEAERES